MSIWIVRDYERCTGCQRCELACSLHHEGWMWPEASRVRIFMPFPGVEVPHLCVQCDDYPCVDTCPVNAITVDPKTTAVHVDTAACISCGQCIKACPGEVPFLHPETNKAAICDLCGGDPECVKACSYDCIRLATRSSSLNYDLYAIKPEEITNNLVINLYGEKGEEFIE